ncbi:hypothetical protein [Glutamicibacter ardleyensis]|uniref:hypothetical protein n=1 Tax=Glutamicibacter ardleyensis TaxID=225894 RepID=UPI003FD53435
MSLTSRLRGALRDTHGSVMIDSAVSAAALGLFTVSTVSLFAVFLGHATNTSENLDQDRANRNAVSTIVALKGDGLSGTPEVRTYDGDRVKVWTDESAGQSIVYASNPECGAPNLDGCRYASQHLISGQGATADGHKRDISISDSTDDEYDLRVPLNVQSIRYLLTDIPVGSKLVVHPGEDTDNGLPLMRQEIPLPGTSQDRDNDGTLEYVSGVIELPEKLDRAHNITVEVLDRNAEIVPAKPLFYTLDKAE